jgi:hypothetical protein
MRTGHFTPKWNYTRDAQIRGYKTRTPVLSLSEDNRGGFKNNADTDLPLE